ncbi:MAG: SRPBCC family protein [Mycobacteriales bacterium]
MPSRTSAWGTDAGRRGTSQDGQHPLSEQLRAESRSRAAAPVLFALLEDGSRWQDWAGLFVPRSRWQEPGDPVGSVGAVRRLGIGPLISLERVVEHVPDRRIAYVVDSWAPYRDYRAEVDLLPDDAGGTQVVWQARFTPRVPGSGPLLRAGLQRIVAGFARNLARAADRAVDPAGSRSSEQ